MYQYLNKNLIIRGGEELKNFYNITYEIKALMALFFMSIIMTYGVISIIVGNKVMPLELLWEFILLGVIIGGIQVITYDERFLSKIQNKIKVLAHYIILLVILIGFIKYFNWVELWGISFNLFIIIYTVYFIAVFLNFYFYKKLTGEKFNDKLMKYKENL